MKFPKLFSAVQIGPLKLPNRIVYSPCGTATCTSDGFITDKMIDLYIEYARGGAALICIEDSMIDPLGRRGPHNVSIYDDKFIPGMRRLAEAIKGHGSLAAIHLSHGGRACGRLHRGQLSTEGRQIPVAPSAVAIPSAGWTVPRELTIEEIVELEGKYAQAAWRGKEAGFDVVWLHGAHLYLINEFLSPFSNKRNDAYGGDHARRLRFLLEIVKKVKLKIGDDFPLMVSLNAEEVAEGGLTIEDTRQNARALQAAGVHAIRLSLGDIPEDMRKSMTYLPLYSAAPMRTPRGYLVHLAAAVKDAVSIPVMVAGRIITPELAEKILEQERVDIIGIARGLFADPEWPNKAKEGREREIRHCISCKFCSKITRTPDAAISCVVNPRYAREAETKITPAEKPKTVFIAGGGPAGLEAARVAALRGHKVTLYEKDKLGGQINLACVPPGKSDVKLFLDYERVQMELLGVNVKNEELTTDTVLQEKPDAVVVATGALPVHPDFPGSGNENVVTAWQVLDGTVVPKGRVVILGGKVVGAETAEYLASKGNRVTIVEPSTQIASDALFVLVGDYLRLSLQFLGVNMLTETVFEGVTKAGVTVNCQGLRSTIEADTVVLALGNKPNQELTSQLEKLGIELHSVGDCASVGKMVKAIREGFQAGMAL